MSTPAVVMMIGSILLVWGGLIASILFMRARPQVSREDPDQVPEGDTPVRLPRPRRDR